MGNIHNIYKHFETDEVVTKVLHGISFEISHGEFVAIMGPSGSGKSTLMHILGFLDRPTSGEYIFEGENITEFNDNRHCRQMIIPSHLSSSKTSLKMI